MSSDAQFLNAQRDPTYKWKVLGVVMMGTLMAALDSSIVNISLPNIMADYGASLDDIEWVITGYMISFATLMPLTAWLRDRVGHKKLYVWSLAVFTGGSLLCGAAWSLPMLIVARVIQALGGGAMTPVGMSMINDVFEPSEKGKALGYFSMGVIVGPAVGPTLGGFLTHMFGWRSIFLVNLPIGVLAIILSTVFLMKDKPQANARQPFDTGGFLFCSLFMVSFLLGVSKGEHEGWTSHYILTCWVLSFVGLVGFLLVESQVKNRVVELDLFKYPVFTICLLVSAVRSVALFGAVFLLPLFMQNFMGLDEIESGLVLLPGSVFMACLMPVAGKLGDRVGPRLLSLVGIVLLAYFMWMYRTLDANTSVWGVIAPTFVRAVGMALLMTPVMATALNAIPRRLSGQASSLLSLAQQVAGSIGIAVLATVLTHRTMYHLNAMGSSMDASSTGMGNSMALLKQHALNLGYSHQAAFQAAQGLLTKNAEKAAQISGFDDAFIVGTIIVISAFIPALFLPSKPISQAKEISDPAELVAAD
jgi:EmrB/QacA subfamily drug resistance transporter